MSHVEKQFAEKPTNNETQLSRMHPVSSANEQNFIFFQRRTFQGNQKMRNGIRNAHAHFVLWQGDQRKKIHVQLQIFWVYRKSRGTIERLYSEG